MEEFTIKVAGAVVSIRAMFETTRVYCREYLSEEPPEALIAVSADDLPREQARLDAEAAAEGLKRRKFPDPFLERSVIQHRLAAHLLGRDTLMMHGSTVGLDGGAYLFTAPCGTGKSTHTRLWRETFGQRTIMVNDDKPFLRLSGDGIYACGSPWTGKHGLGSNVSLPLCGICVLRRGTKNRIRRISADDQADFLRSQCFIPDDLVMRDQALTLIDELLSRVPLWELECTKEPEAAIVAADAMTKYIE